MSTAPIVRKIVAAFIRSRFSGANVSGMREIIHIRMSAAWMARIQKIQRHGANQRIACPKLGATTGISMNTARISDMTRAIASPLNRSRMMPTEMTRLAPAKKPAEARPIRSSEKLCATAHAMVESTNNTSAPPITFLRPKRSDRMPNSSDPAPNPRK